MKTFLVGARGSALSLAQSEGAVRCLTEHFPRSVWKILPVSSPGDRDQVTSLEESAPDFFTRDLDEAVRSGALDCAIHSAKDLPGYANGKEMVGPGLDWIWLPQAEDPRDVLVKREGVRSVRKVGVSSARRRMYAERLFPKAKQLPIRGTIEKRLEQVRSGRFDAVFMALAALKRLGLWPLEKGGLTGTALPLDDFPTHEAQGHLALVFRLGDKRFQNLRDRFVKAVRFVSAGVGDCGYCTLVGARDIRQADVILYDDLMGDGLLQEVLKDCPSKPILIPVGKRCGAHSMAQTEITRRLCDEVRKGRRVVRLKGGDAGLFGRLTEETDALIALKIPFVVRAGVSALTAATTTTGMLLTQRDVSATFEVTTRRSAGKEVPTVYFMSTRLVKAICSDALKRGVAKERPCSLVFDATGPRECIVRGTIGVWARKAPASRKEPGVFIIGDTVQHTWPRLGLLKGVRVLVTCSEQVRDKALMSIEDRGGRPIWWPMIHLLSIATFKDLSGYDAIVLTSPSAVRLFFESYTGDVRQMPAIYTCGAGTDETLRKYGLRSDVMPESDFSATGLMAACRAFDLKGKRILRLRSERAGNRVTQALRRQGAHVQDVILYRNEPVSHTGSLPRYEAVFFASASAVSFFVAAYGEKALASKKVFVLGKPTWLALPRSVRMRENDIEMLPLW